MAWLLASGKPRTITANVCSDRVTISLQFGISIKKVLREEPFDIIHLHEHFMPMLCSAVLRFSNTVNIGTFHASRGSPGYNFGWPISRIMLKRRAHKLDGKIAVSKSAMEFAHDYVPGYYHIIPNGIDLDHFSSDLFPID